MGSLADAFFSMVQDSRDETYTLPDGHVLHIGELTGLDWVEWRLAIQKAREASDDGNDRFADARLIMLCVHDGKGSLVFKPGDEAKIMGMPRRHVQAILEIIERVNFAPADAKKNAPEMPASPSGSSATSDSPAASAA